MRPIHLLFVLMTSCQAQRGNQPAAPIPSEATPSSVSPADAPVTRSITFEPDEVAYGEDGETVISPGSRIRSATYERFVVSTAALEQVLGGRPTARASVTVTIHRSETSTHTPTDPMAAAPDQGFRFITHYAEPVSQPPQ